MVNLVLNGINKYIRSKPLKSKDMANYASLFKAQLSNGGYLDNLYYNLFSIKSDSELDILLEYLHMLSLGKDEYWGDEAVIEWFAIWHKSIRQTGFFYYLNGTKTVDKATQEQKLELKTLNLELESLKKQVIVSPKVSYEAHEASYAKLYAMPEYKAIMDKRKLINNVVNTKVDLKLNGLMDNTLYNLIHIDDGFLYKALLRTFRLFEIEKL
jgi:hypothetical protein